MKYLGWLFGLENVTSIDAIDPSLAAPWASDEFGPFWVYLGAATLFVLAIVFYLRFQPRGTTAARVALGVSRGLLLVLLFLTLADPVLRITVKNIQRPHVYVVFDGTDSMAIQDELPADERAAMEKSVGMVRDPAASADNKTSPSRMDYVRALVGNSTDNLLVRLQDDKHVQLQPFLFDGNSTSQLRKLPLNASGGDKLDPRHVADQLTTKGQVTAIGTVLDDVTQQFGSGNLAAVVFVSDFAHNSGAAPLGTSEQSPAAKLGVPIYAVGVGATEAVDLAVDLQTDPKMKKAERTNVVVKLRQAGLQGQTVGVNVVARRLSGEAGSEATAETVIGHKSVTLNSAVETVDFPFTPQEAGRFEFFAEVAPLEGEIVDQNNHATREVNVIDDYLRLMYVAHEPTWEWRFIKEVFHRDKLVGMKGFRTFLGSSDPRVRESNVLFLSTLTPKRSDFFANDVIFLDDMPQTSLNPRFCEMVKEYVGELGGGLVVIAGPRFGPRELHGSPLADMLPVITDPNGRLRDEREFAVKLTPHASRYAFMRLGESDVENTRAWNNLGQLPWYQPVAALHDQAYALAEHPTDTCADGKTHQPLIAVRPYGKGEVVYLAFNESWRLRRKYGEKYYRQFWSQLIYRLGMSHALGDSKRFVPRLDRQQYRADEKVTFTIEAFDENYEPLTDEKLGDRTLTAELTLPGQAGAGPQTREISVPLLRKGVFEARFPVYTPGEYTLRVKDPITNKFEERRFEVTSLSAERRRGVRDLQLQTELANRTHGRSYELTNVANLLQDLQVKPRVETVTRNHALWSTPLWFIVLIALMLGEWFSRKMIRLT